jgi:hypothetical protein
LCEIEIVPADNGVFNQATTAFSNLLLNKITREKFLIVAKGNGSRELIGVFTIVTGGFSPQITNVAFQSSGGVEGCRCSEAESPIWESYQTP